MNDNRYRIIIHQNPNNLGTEVIAVSSYAGRPVRGKAICAPDDIFNEEDGIALAKARCDLKIAEKRLKRADRKAAEAEQMVDDAAKHLSKMVTYQLDANAEVEAATLRVQSLLEKL